MNPADDHTVPTHSVHPVSAALINAPKNPTSGLAPPIQKVLPPDHPAVASGVKDLEDMFKDSLAPSEVAFHAAQLPVKPTKQSVAPASFLNAHMAIIDQLLINPGVTTTRLATLTGYSMNWLHKVMQSDAFQAKLAERQKALVDPLIFNAIKDRLSGATSRALEIIEERLEGDEVSMDTALSVLAVTGKAMGLGQQKNAPVLAQQFIVHVPARATSATDWAAEHSGRPAQTVSEPIDLNPVPSEAPHDHAA